MVRIRMLLVFGQTIKDRKHVLELTCADKSIYIFVLLKKVVSLIKITCLFCVVLFYYFLINRCNYIGISDKLK